jgi:hypothetical protein
MKLKQLGDALTLAWNEFGLDGIDILMLHEVVTAQGAGGEVTIMNMINNFSFSSPATAHKKIKRLCDKHLLIKVGDTVNLRLKRLEKGARYDEFIERLKSN